MSGSAEKVKELLKKRGAEGVLQIDLVEELNYSRSTISETLTKLENSKDIIRRKVDGKTKRVWSMENVPFPIKGYIRVGMLKTVEYPHSLLTVDKLREDFNIKVRVYNSAMKATRALSRGQLDIGFTPLITQAMFSSLMRSIKIYGGSGFRGSGLIHREGENLEDLNYGCSELSTMETNLKTFLERKGVDPSSVNITYFRDPERMVESYVSGEIDGLSIWEPYFTTIKGVDDTEALEFSEELGDYPCCTLAANQEFVEKNEEAFKTFMSTYIDVTDQLNSGDERVKRKAVELIEETMDYDKNIILTTFDNFGHNYELSRDQFRDTLKNFGINPTSGFTDKVLDLSFIS